ncbi:MAG: lysoplasmalogenase family protein [Oscillospiraceae bacterium]|jgi:hypothetical protein|nr:lysoplasmalogenase family protein [Oscillospiraceae bacterium]
MIPVLALGMASVLAILCKPLRFLGAGAASGFASKALASSLFCAAGVAAAAQRDTFSLSAAALLLAMLLALTGDLLLAIEPILEYPTRDRSFFFVMGALPFFLAHALNMAVLWYSAPFSVRMLLRALLSAFCWALLWLRGVWKPGAQGVALLLYGTVLGAAMAAAVELCAVRVRLGVVVLPASLAFIASDTALFSAVFGRGRGCGWIKRHFSLCVMLPYYAAQALMALCILWI